MLPPHHQRAPARKITATGSFLAGWIVNIHEHTLIVLIVPFDSVKLVISVHFMGFEFN